MLLGMASWRFKNSLFAGRHSTVIEGKRGWDALRAFLPKCLWLNHMKNLFNMDQRSSLSHISVVISSKPALYQLFIYFCNPKTPETSYIAGNVPGTYQSQALD